MFRHGDIRSAHRAFHFHAGRQDEIDGGRLICQGHILERLRSVIGHFHFKRGAGRNLHRLHLRLVQKQHTLITHRQCKRISKRGIGQIKRCAVCHNRTCAGEGIGRHRIRVEDKFARADGDTVCRGAIPRKATLTGFGHGAAVGHHRHLYFQRCARSHFNYAAINLERVVVGSVFKVFHHIVTGCDRKLGVVPGADIKPFRLIRIFYA